MQPGTRLGIFTHTEGAGDPRRIYQETLELFVAAEELGFDVGWLAEHHFKPVAGRLPSLFPFLAAASQRTQRLRLGAAVILLPYSHALRVAEDAAVVDTLSDGRLELGVGGGLDPLEFEAFGVDFAQRHAITTASFTTLQAALRGEPLGEHRQLLEPPAPTLANRLWQAAMSRTGAQYVARLGAGLVLARQAQAVDQRTDESQIPIVETYLENWRETTPPRIAVSRSVYPTVDRRTALAELREGVMRIAQGMSRRGVLPAGLALEEYCAAINIAYGHPDEVIESLAADKVIPYATDLILQFNPASPPLHETIRICEEIATRIAPSLGWRPQWHTHPLQELA